MPVHLMQSSRLFHILNNQSLADPVCSDIELQQMTFQQEINDFITLIIEYAMYCRLQVERLNTPHSRHQQHSKCTHAFAKNILLNL